ncbi:MAG: hypothetical protein CO128_00465 [Ignavibacteriales bacterium CG_4_9_14_3_um_filter_30_11]|nr:MAG: hypothetical protein CO128_00465 [Ignavibacteriales bacterium CG_4_9_14_3_um_filter_30_11]
MNEIEKLDQLIDMLGASISDVESCKEDIKHLDEDFLQRYPDYSNPNLSSDWKKMLDNIKSDYLYFRRRNYVKTVFSSIEGILFAMKRILLIHSDKLSDEEIINLQEYKLVGPPEHKLKKKIHFLKTDENVKFVIRTYEKAKTTGFTTNLKEDDWEKFRLSIEIRNRITHPKHSSDLLISEDEIETVMQAHDWFFKVFNDLQKNEINLFG